MPQLTIRNIDDALYARLKLRARLNRRSLEAELRSILEQQATPDRASAVQAANAFRLRLAGRYKGNVAAEIRAQRDR